MKCITSPALDNVEIAMYVDGEAEEAVVAHINECAYCRERARQWTRLQNRLKQRSYRVNCPTPMELGEYHLGYLPDPQELVIARHLRECLLCRGEVAYLEEYLKEPGRPSGLIMSVKVQVARLLGAGSEQDVFSTPAFAGLRGEEDEPFIYQADNNIRIMIEVQDDVEQMGLKTLLGLVTGLETNEFTIQVHQGEQLIAAAPVDEIGNFVISHLSPGHYKLILRGPNIEIHIQSLPVI